MRFFQNSKVKTTVLIIALFLIWRLFLFAPLFAGEKFLHFRPGYLYTKLSYYNYLFKGNVVNNFLISPWANFDGVAYLAIAGKGYTAGNARFFPLFPIAISFASGIFGKLKPFNIGQVIVAFSLSNIFFLGAVAVFYKLVRFDYSKKIAILSVIFLLLFPTSFFFGSIYTESLFLLLTLLSFYFARKKQWILAAIFGILLSATRIIGVFILPALLWEFFKEESFKNKNDLFKAIPLLFIPAGLLIYIYFNFTTWHDPLFFYHQQGNVQNGRSVNSAVFIPQTIYRYIKILLTVSPASHFEWWISLLELAVFIFGCFMIYVMWRKKIRPSYIIYSLFCFIIPTLSGTFSGLPRYFVIIFPAFLALAMVKNRIALIIYSVISIILLFLFLMFFSKGYFIA